MQLRRPWDWNDPWPLRQDPSERDLRGRDAALCRDLAAGTVPLWGTVLHVAYLSTLAVVGTVVAVRGCARKLEL